MIPRTLPLLVTLVCFNLPSSAAETDCTFGILAKESTIKELCKFEDGMARFAIDERWGFIDRAGKVAIAPQFEYAEDFSEGLAAVQLNATWGVIDKQGQWVVEPKFEGMGRFSGAMAPASLASQWGYVDRSGKWLIAPRFALAGAFAGTVAVAGDRGGQPVMIDRSGRVIKRFEANVMIDHNATADGLFKALFRPPPMLVHVDGRSQPLPPGADKFTYQSGHFVAAADSKGGDDDGKLLGLVDLAGTWVIAPAFSRLQPFHGKLAVASPAANDKLFGLIDKKGNFVVKPVYEYLPHPVNGLYQATRPGGGPKTDFFDQHGKLRFSLDCGEVSTYARSVTWTEVLGCKTTWIVHGERGVVSSFADERLVSYSGDHVLLQNRTGNDKPFAADMFNGAGKRVWGHEALPAAFQFVAFVANPGTTLPFAIAGEEDGKVALLNQRYELVLLPDAQQLGTFDSYFHAGGNLDGPLVMKGEQGWGAVDPKGNWVIAPKYTKLSPFQFGIAYGQFDGKNVLVDATGKTYPSPPADVDFKPIAPMVMLGLREDGKGSHRYDVSSGVMTRSTATWDVVAGKFVGGLMPVEQNGKFGLMNEQLKLVTPATFDSAPEPVTEDKKLIGWISRRHVNDGRHGVEMRGWLGPLGNELVAPRYTSIRFDGNGLLRVTEGGEMNGILGTGGQIVMAPTNAFVLPLEDGWIAVVGNLMTGLLNQKGEWHSKPSPLNMPVPRASAPVSYAYVERKGAAAAPLVLVKGGDASGQLATVIAGGQLGLSDKGGNVVLQGGLLCDYLPVIMDGKKNIVWERDAGAAAGCQTPPKRKNKK